MKHTSGLGFCGWVCWLIGLVAGIAAFAMSQEAVGLNCCVDGWPCGRHIYGSGSQHAVL